MTSTKRFSAAERMARTRALRTQEQRVELWLPKCLVAQLDALARRGSGSTRAMVIKALVKRSIATTYAASQHIPKSQPVAIPGGHQ